MSDTTTDLSALRTSTSDLLAGLAAEGWSEADVSADSLLPGWTRGHVLNHIARNAESINRTLSGALRGEIVARYPRGMDGRAADIEAGAHRPAAELLGDVTDTAQQLDEVLGQVADVDGWDLPTDKDWPARHWLHQRMNEVEIHRVDLGGSYTADRWPVVFVGRMLPLVAGTLAKRTDESLHVVVDAAGSVTSDHAETEWTVGSGSAVDVRGPDWAVLAWLIGRPEASQGRLTATPGLRPWN